MTHPYISNSIQYERWLTRVIRDAIIQADEYREKQKREVIASQAAEMVQQSTRIEPMSSIRPSGVALYRLQQLATDLSNQTRFGKSIFMDALILAYQIGYLVRSNEAADEAHKRETR